MAIKKYHPYMKRIIQLVKKMLLREVPPPVGRWRREDCNTKMNQKIDLSNEDHCGPCGQYALDKTETNSNKNVDISKK